MTDFAALIRPSFGRAIQKVREEQGLARRLVTANDALIGERNTPHQVVKFPVAAPAADPYDVVPGEHPPATTDVGDPKTVDLELTFHKAQPIEVTPIDWSNMENDVVNDLWDTTVADAIRNLSNTISREVFSPLFKGVAFSSGSTTDPLFQKVPPGSISTPGPEDNLQAFFNADSLLNKTGMARTGRFLATRHSTENAIRTLDQFQLSNQAGDTEARDRGTFGRIANTDFFADAFMTSHTAGTNVGATVVDVAPVIGDSTVSMVTAGGGSLEFLVGDLISFDGAEDGHTYAVRTATGAIGGATTVVVDITPDIRADIETGLAEVVDTAAVSLVPDHSAEILAQTGAFGVMMRQDTGPARIFAETGFLNATITDEVTNFVYNVWVWPQYRQVRWEISVLMGAKVIDPQKALRLLQPFV